ncbi:putative Protein SOGA3 [Hypsibius exemplaris]|uniref:Nucleoprotein TPR n=1 Tax=Hypsibius exemplaris TaxID=2072580 RepID=A0A1W0X2S3_HYPEX|nr:putative Protein SOGA3 [Hypsibius exemplaris]
MSSSSSVTAASSSASSTTTANSAAASSNTLNKPAAANSLGAPPTSSSSSSSSKSAPSSTCAKNDLRCSGFEAQVFRKTRCKKCLRDKVDHSTGPTTTTSTTPGPPVKPPDVVIKKVVVPVAVPTVVTSPLPSAAAVAPQQNAPTPILKASSSTKPPLPVIVKPAGVPGPVASVHRTGSFKRPCMMDEHLNTTTQTIILSKTSPQVRRASSSSEAGVRRNGRNEARRFSEMAEDDEDEDRMVMRTPLSGSLASMGESASDLQSMHTAISGSTMSLSSDATFVSSRENYQDTVEELQATVEALQARLEERASAFRNLEDEAADLREQLNTPLKAGGSLGGSFRKRDDLHAANKKIKELEKENAELNSGRQSLQIELEQMRECMDEVNDPDEANQPLLLRVRDVLHKLDSAEMMCEDLLDENQDLKKELRALEAEMDELHDNFRQDQAMEFQTIQKELELTMKNCRILQFKLRKSERKCDEIESDKMLYEVKLRQLTSVSAGSSLENGQLRELANELQQTKEVNKRLQEEIEHIEEERNSIKTGYDILAKTCMDLEKQRDAQRSQVEKLKNEGDSARKSSSHSNDAYHQTSEQSHNAQYYSQSPPKGQYDTNQLLRDLHESVERQTDLRDQLNFAEEEAKRLRKQVTDMEHDNESLQRQLKKISSARNSGDFSKSGEVLEAMRSNEELKMQLDVSEHDISSLKRRLSETEHANDNLTTELKHMKASFQELKEAKDKIAAIMEEPESSGPGRPRSYYEQKIKLLEAETNDLRKKLVDKERQLERMTSEVEIAKRKGGQLNRSKSLDDYQVVDLKRQLQMAEQEITQLRQKATALEADNDRLSADYKRLQFKVGTKRGSTEEIEVPRSKNNRSMDDQRSGEDSMKYQPDLAVLASTGKSAQSLVDELSSLKKHVDENKKVMAAARTTFERVRGAKPALRKDVATRQELKTRIDDLEKDLQSSILVAEQESTSAQRLFTEVEEIRSKIQREVPDLPISDEVKDARLKLLAAEQQIDTLRTEIKDLQNNLTEERRRTRSNDSESFTKERSDTELRNLKQELGRQRYMAEELLAKENMLSKQVMEWQKKYHSLKEAYKGDTDAWQKELTDFEHELAKEKSLRAAELAAKDSAKSLDKEVQSLRQKLASYEDQIRNLIEAGKLKEKEWKDKLTKTESDLTKEKSDHQTFREKHQSKDAEVTAEMSKVRCESDKLKSQIENLQREQYDNQALSKKESDKLKAEVEIAKKAKNGLEKEVQDLKAEVEKLKGDGRSQLSPSPRGGLSAYERQKASDQIKEEVEKLHKQNYDLQKQLLDARRAGDEAAELIARNERKWASDRDEVNRKLRQDEKIHKAEISAVTMRFENKQKLLEDEIKTMSSSVKQLKKERETLQERLDDNLREVQKLRHEHADSSAKLETAGDGFEKQLEDAQSKTIKYEQERNEAKSRAAKEKSSYELRISELQDKLSQYEGQHAKLSAYALKTRNLSPSSTATTRSRTNGELDESNAKEKLEVVEKALKRSEKEVIESRAQVSAIQLDKQRESDLLRAKIRELQDKLGPINDAHNSLKLAYDSMRTEYEVVRIDRDDLAERFSETESSQIKERGKIDQILAEIQRLKEVAPLFTSDEDIRAQSPKRTPRVRQRDAFFDDKSATLDVPDHKKNKGKKSADLQKAIDNITKVSEDIKAERKTRRPILPYGQSGKRSHSASIAEAGCGPNPPMRRYPSVDADESSDNTNTVTLPAPTPLRAIQKPVAFPSTRNPRFPSIPPSFLVTPPSTVRDNLRSRSYEKQSVHGSAGAISEECFRDPGGSWDSIDSDISIESWNYPSLQAAAHRGGPSERFVSMPNLPEKVDSATSTDDKPRRGMFDAAKAKKKIMARLRPLSQHSSKESLQESVEVTSTEGGSSGFFDRLTHPNTAMTQTSRTPSPSPQPSTKLSMDTKSSVPPSPVATVAVIDPVVPAVVPKGSPGSPYKTAVPKPGPDKGSKVSQASGTLEKAAASQPSVNAASGSAKPAGAEKDTRLKDDKISSASGRKPLDIKTWRKPISDLAKKFETKK